MSCVSRASSVDTIIIWLRNFLAKFHFKPCKKKRNNPDEIRFFVIEQSENRASLWVVSYMDMSTYSDLENRAHLPDNT